MAFRVQIRRDPSGKWIVNNPILLSGEFGYETDTSYMKIGDGATPWNYLPYWNTGQGVTGPSASLYSLPSPAISLVRIPVNGATGATSCYLDSRMTGGVTGDKFVLTNGPSVSTTNLTTEQIDAGVWIEMVYYRTARGKQNSSGKYLRDKGFKILTPQINGVNTLTNDIINLYPEQTHKFNTRGGIHTEIHMNVYNHFKVTQPNTSIDMTPYFNGLFSYKDIGFRGQNPERNNNEGLLNCLVPAMRFMSSTDYGRRFCYDTNYRPLYVKFRYIMWDPKANSNRGGFITGPLSETVKIASPVPPFLIDFNRSYTTQSACGIINPNYKPEVLRCWIESNIPL
jgi:hypothetical protein